ncbi:autotransporter-associated beta strand repeat-containing protein [Alphaproteobacteria bacterium LMG 31809]|uniref:Autotransporter-associated beta strand repeat-containing protein n=2 Tax=Govanella unica TaxID=2975056 RepID=A0A9X3TVA0_9PROT|nr:autotransporter-associated beta strand repeat-containing protein [Govania unica]
MGAGGSGIVGNALALTLNATATGGLNGNNTIRAKAIDFTGGANALVLGSGWGLTGDIGVAGSLDLSATADSVLSSAITGSGSVTKTGATTITLTGTNSFAGVLTISAGTLQVGNGDTAGSVSGNILNNGALVFNRSDNVTHSSAINGTGSVTQSGTGKLIFTADNGYSGGTTIDTGSTLQVGDGGFTGSLGSGDIVNNGTLSINRDLATSLTLDQAISGTGALEVTSGDIYLTGNNSYSGTTTIASAFVIVGDNTTTGSLGSGAVVNNGTLYFARSNEHTVNNAISGTGEFGQMGAGKLIYTGTSTSTGQNTIASGRTLQIGNGGTSGNLGTGAVANRGSLIFNRSDSVTQSGLISGSGTLRQSGSGTLILTGNNIYNGATTIDADATLQIGNGGTSGSLGVGAVTNAGTLAFNRADAVTFNRDISGSGALRQSGSGTLIFTADHSYSGGTTIDAGTTIQLGTGSSTTGSLGSGTITNNGTLDIRRSFAPTLTFSQLITGSGNLTVTSGGVVLNEDNDYSGTTTIASGAGLALGTFSSKGSLGSGAVVNDGMLYFARSNEHTVNNAISGTGEFRQRGAGKLIYTGTSTSTGQNTIDSGTTLQIGNGSTSGNLGTGAVENNGSLIFNRADSVTQRGAISGSGTLRQSGSGTLILTANNSYSGPTAIEAGATLQVGNGGTSGTLGTGAVTNAGTLAFNRSDIFVVNNNILGGGALRQSGSGTLTLTGANSYTGATMIDAGATLQVGNGGTSGTLGTGAVLNAGTLVFDRADAITYAGVLSGSGDIVHTGAGVLTLTGVNSYTGTLTVDTGSTLQLGDGGTSGRFGSGDLVNNGLILINRSDNYVIANDIFGTGEIHQVGTGTFVLTGNHYSVGMTRVDAGGTVQIGNGGLLGSLGAGTFENEGALAFNASNSVIYTGVISGNGTVIQSGSGALTLTGTQTYTGATTINSGTLVVNGSIAASSGVVVNAGGKLGGSGTVSGLTLNGGTLSPGNSPGTLTVTGNLVMDANSTYLAEVEGGVADRVNVTGTATLGGTLRLVPLGGTYNFDSDYTLLSAAGGLGGTSFATVDPTGFVGAGITTTVTYSGNDVLLKLAPKALASLGVTAPANAARISAAIDAAVANGTNASALFGIYNLQAGLIPAAVNELSGEIHAAAPAMANAAASAFLGTLLDGSGAGRLRRDPNLGTVSTERFALWAAAFGSTGHTDGHPASGAAKRNLSDHHLAIGAELRLNDSATVGASVAGGKTSASVSAGLGAADADVFQAGLYGRADLGALNLAAAVGYARLDTDTTRAISSLGVSNISSSYVTKAWSGRIEASVPFETLGGQLTFAPIAAFQAIRAKSPAIIEQTTANAGHLSLDHRVDTSSRSELGLKLDTNLTAGSTPVVGFVRASWAHYFKYDTDVSASLNGVTGVSYTIAGTRPSRNAALLSAGADIKLTPRVSFGMRAYSELSDTTQTVGGTAEIKGSF